MAIEQVLIFLAGLVMFMIFLTVFQAYQTGYTGLAQQDVLDLVGQEVYGGLVKVGAFERGSLELAVPRDAGGIAYDIRMNESGLLVHSVAGGVYSFTTLNAFSGMVLQGSISSLRGMVSIHKEGNTIILSE